MKHGSLVKNKSDMHPDESIDDKWQIVEAVFSEVVVLEKNLAVGP